MQLLYFIKIYWRFMKYAHDTNVPQYCTFINQWEKKIAVPKLLHDRFENRDGHIAGIPKIAILQKLHLPNPPQLDSWAVV